MGDPWAQFGTKAGSMVQVGKALSVLGYSNWSALEPVEQQENDGYVGEQLNIRLFEKVQEIEAKRKKEQKQETKRGSKKGKGEQKNQLAPGAAGGANKKSRGMASLVDEERAIHEAYQVLLTEHHKRRAKRKRRALQTLKKEEQLAQENPIQDAFSHIRRKSNATLVSK